VGVIAAVAAVAAGGFIEFPFACVEGRCCGPDHTCAAAFEAAVGGLFLRLLAILPPELVRSLLFDLRVFNIPPDFFSGLGVLSLRPFGWAGGASLAVVAELKLLVLPASSPELIPLEYEGRVVGRGMSAYDA
jgi:hypothetical protein